MLEKVAIFSQTMFKSCTPKIVDLYVNILELDNKISSNIEYKDLY